MSYLESYNRCQTDPTSKERAVIVINDYFECIKPDLLSERVTYVFYQIGKFKLARDHNKGDTIEQESCLDGLYRVIEVGYESEMTVKTGSKISPPPIRVFLACCSVMKNSSSLFNAKIPQTLKYLVEKYVSHFGYWEKTASLTYLIDNSDNLKADNRRRLDDAAELHSKLKAKTAIVGAFNNFKEKKYAAHSAEYALKPVLAEVLEKVSNVFSLVPTAEFTDNFSHYNPNSNPVLKANPNSHATERQELKDFILDLSSRIKSQGGFRMAKDNAKKTYNDLKSSISNRIGSCNEFALLLAIALKNDARLVSIRHKVKVFSLERPDDHVMVGIENYCGNGELLILDAWIKQIILRQKDGYRPKDILKTDIDRRGFLGSKAEYIRFLNDHESDRYVLDRNVYKFSEHKLKEELISFTPDEEKKIYKLFNPQ